VEITFTYIDEQSRKVDCSFGCERNDEVVEGCMYKWIDELQNTQKHLQQEIAELKEKEAQIQQSLSLLRSTLESTAHGIVTVSLKGDILGFNQRIGYVAHTQFSDAIQELSSMPSFFREGTKISRSL
jgi:PAS domain-containing protein